MENSEHKGELEDQTELEQCYLALEQWDEEVIDHNLALIASLGNLEDYNDLLEDVNVYDKITLVDKPSGIKQAGEFGVFTDIHVEQWSTGMEGDSFSGFIYANANGQWIKIPYSC